MRYTALGPPTPDFQGNRIPAAATDGTVLWVRADLVPVMGRLVVLQRHKGVASNYDCGSCVCPTSLLSSRLILCHTTENLLPQGTHTCHAMATYRDCNFQYYYVDVGLCWATSWSSSAPAVATIDNTNTSTKGLLKGLSGGSSNISVSFTGSAYSYNPFLYPYCFASPVNTNGGTTANVVTVSIIGGNNFAFVGTDSSVKGYNREQAEGKPSGGTYTWSASNSRVSFDNPSAALVTLTGNSASTGLLDTTLTVNYSYNQKPATPATRAITVRIFKFLQQSGSTQVIPVTGPPNWGYNAYAYYNIYTNPSGQLVSPGFSNMNTFEAVSVLNKVPSNVSVNLISGSGATNANSQVVDDLSLLSPDGPLPDNLDVTVSQDLSVGGIYVRNNTTHYYKSGPVITNNGPYN